MSARRMSLGAGARVRLCNASVVAALHGGRDAPVQAGSCAGVS